MTDQTPLPFPDLVVPEPAAGIQERAENFAAANPQLMAWLTERALFYKAKGVRVGMKFLAELARVEFEAAKVARDEQSDFLINNDYPSRWARLLMDAEPRLAGYFAIRELRAA